jgi:cyclohexyl-isocyanide hydratase
MKRRDFGKLTAAGLLAGLLEHEVAAQNAKPSDEMEKKHLEAMRANESLTAGTKVTIGMLVYPGMFLQDLVGPLAMFESLMNREIHLVWKNRDPLVLPGEKPLIPVTASTTFKECPADLDVLFVPGGALGTLALMEDLEALRFLAERGKTAKYVTSVCTGSLVLGAAGLLKGYRATSYWLAREVLKEFGAIPTDGRVVIDRNRITGGGVTAGLDFGLTLVAKLRNQTYAEAVQLYLEYDPHPPFSAGSPETAPPVAKKFITDMLSPFNVAARAAAIRAQKRLG